MGPNRSRRALATGLAAALVVLDRDHGRGRAAGPWATAVNAESLAGTSADLNTSSNDGCPIESPTASVSTWPRTGRGATGASTSGWRAAPTTDAGFGTPVNLGTRDQQRGR